jgi:hypothetical protein
MPTTRATSKSAERECGAEGAEGEIRMRITKRTTGTVGLIAVHVLTLGFIFAHVFACARSGAYATLLNSPAHYARDGLAVYTLLLMLVSGWVLNNLLDRLGSLLHG